jgi:hypothetical protein
MIFNDKEIRVQVNSLFNLVLTIARMQGIDPKILFQESLNVKANMLYMLQMFQSKKGDDK